MRPLVFVLLMMSAPFMRQPAAEPIVRIGLTQNAASVTIRSAQPFPIEGRVTRSAAFAMTMTIDANRRGAVAASHLQYRLTVALDDGTVVVPPPGGRVRIEPPAAPLEIETRAYRGALEIFANTRRTLTVVNELPLETYLLGVVPNELNPDAFGQLEALKAQAVAARTYIVRNRGQYAKPRTISDRERELLRMIADAVMTEVELRAASRDLSDETRKLAEENRTLQGLQPVTQPAGIVAPSV